MFRLSLKRAFHNFIQKKKTNFNEIQSAAGANRRPGGQQFRVNGSKEAPVCQQNVQVVKMGDAYRHLARQWGHPGQFVQETDKACRQSRR